MRDTWYKQGRGKNGVLLEMKLMHAESRGTVRLRSADPNDPPIIDPNYLKESVDVEDLRKGNIIGLESEFQSLESYDIFIE